MSTSGMKITQGVVGNQIHTAEGRAIEWIRPYNPPKIWQNGECDKNKQGITKFGTASSDQDIHKPSLIT